MPNLFEQNLIRDIIGVYHAHAHQGQEKEDFDSDLEFQIRRVLEGIRLSSIGDIRDFYRDLNKAALNNCFKLQSFDIEEPFKIMHLMSMENKGGFRIPGGGPGGYRNNSPMDIEGYRFEKLDTGKFDFTLRFTGDVTFSECDFRDVDPSKEKFPGYAKKWVRNSILENCVGQENLFMEFSNRSMGYLRDKEFRSGTIDDFASRLIGIYHAHLNLGESREQFRASLDKTLGELGDKVSGGRFSWDSFTLSFNKMALDHCFELQESGVPEPFKIIKMATERWSDNSIKVWDSRGWNRLYDSPVNIQGYEFNNRDFSNFDFNIEFKGKAEFVDCDFSKMGRKIWEVNAATRDWLKDCKFTNCIAEDDLSLGFKDKLVKQIKNANSIREALLITLKTSYFSNTTTNPQVSGDDYNACARMVESIGENHDPFRLRASLFDYKTVSHYNDSELLDIQLKALEYLNIRGYRFDIGEIKKSFLDRSKYRIVEPIKLTASSEPKVVERASAMDRLRDDLGPKFSDLVHGLRETVGHEEGKPKMTKNEFYSFVSTEYNSHNKDYITPELVEGRLRGDRERMDVPLIMAIAKVLKLEEVNEKQGQLMIATPATVTEIYDDSTVSFAEKIKGERKAPVTKIEENLSIGGIFLKRALQRPEGIDSASNAHVLIKSMHSKGYIKEEDLERFEFVFRAKGMPDEQSRKAEFTYFELRLNNHAIAKYIPKEYLEGKSMNMMRQNLAISSRGKNKLPWEYKTAKAVFRSASPEIF